MAAAGFATKQFLDCYESLPTLDGSVVRAGALEALSKRDPTAWSTDPIRTILAGKPLEADDSADASRIKGTPDALGEENGKQIHCSPEDLDAHVLPFVASLKTATDIPRDNRTAVREVEDRMLLDKEIAGQLVADQLVDFGKQDGVTEMEESIECNAIERKLNDVLLAEEDAGRLSVSRAPALIGCVSNFSLFLDLFRKCIRQIEVGVPVVILSRSNTTQHSFRWFQILSRMLTEAGVDQRLCSYVCADIPEQRKLMAACPDSSLYFTGARPVAAKIMEVMPRLVASTGGPNTMIAAAGITDAVADAARMSLGIENSGQCTALRQLVAPGVTAESVQPIFDKMTSAATADAALSASDFCAMFSDPKWVKAFEADLERARAEQGPYTQAHGAGGPEAAPIPAAFKISTGDKDVQLPASIVENWRRMFLDVTSPASREDLMSEAFLNRLAAWFVKEQPIVMAINGDSSEAGYPITRALFEKTCQVVYSVGQTAEEAAAGTGSPALTCQARPQDGEVFGEFPPRKEFGQYTRFPVVVPSATAGYNANYGADFLAKEQAPRAVADIPLAKACATPAAQGYVQCIVDYLADATAGAPHRVTPVSIGPKRTALFGLQRPPMNGTVTVIRAAADTTVDAVAPYVATFYLTNARDQVLVSVAPGNDALVAALTAACPGLNVQTQDNDAFAAAAEAAWNVVDIAAQPFKYGIDEFPLAEHFVGVILPLGHIKSTTPDDKPFIDAISASPKWLKMA